MPPFDKNIFIAITAISVLALVFSYKIDVYLFCIIVVGIFWFFIWYINKIISKQTTPSNKEQQQEKQTSFKPQKSNITFKDIAGMKDIKDEFLDIIAMFQNNNQYKKLNIKPPRGVLLVGKPGVGKTMLARALSNECNTSFFYQSGSSFANMYVGSGANNIKTLFKEAKKHSPCIIFIDEIDALGKSRGNGRSDERESTLNELLTQLDGFEDNGDIMLLGATNKIDIIDKALIRSGRFDRKIFIPLPTKEKRKKIIKFYLDKYPNKVNIDMLLNISIGQSGADISTMINNASLVAFKDKSTHILDKHFHKNHIKKINTYSQKDKSLIALYKSTKFFISAKLGLEVPSEIFIFTNDFIDYTNEITSKTYLEKNIIALLSGMIAVKMIYKDSYYLFKDDLKTINKISKQIKKMGIKTKKNKIKKKQNKKAINLVNKNKDKIIKMQELLLNNETLSIKDL